MRRLNIRSMYIAQLQLKGFKSFGGGHDIVLSPGLTCIVGPNGSGKSNLLDAMRWVLAEGAPSDLRISRQTDLLFQGSASLPQCREAEVCVKLLSGKDTCLIRRKIDREGAALLTVNGSRMRLQELDQVKREWGLEGVRFAFIGQGEISEIIQQRPLQRRMLLEGLFGIDLYRKKREEAVDRLGRAEEELQRIATLLSELEARREEIAPMVEKAGKAQAILTALEEQKRVYYWLRRERSESALHALGIRISLLGREQSTHAFWSMGWNRRKELLERSIAIVQKEMDSCREEGGKASRALQEALRQAASLASALRRDKDQIRLATKEQARKNEALILLEAEEARQRSLSESLASELAEKKALLEALTIERQKKRLEIEKRKAHWKVLSRRKAEQEAEIDAVKARLATLGRQAAGLKDEWRLIEAEGNNLKQSFSEAEALLEKAAGESAAAVESHSAAFAVSQKTAAEITLLRKQENRLASELESVSQKLEGQVLPRPVQFLVAASRLGRLDASPLPFIEAFECPPRFEKAIECYLGARQFWLLVKDMGEARLCIERLRQAGAGRATFLPLERCRSRNSSRRAFDFRKEEGALGWATEILGVEENWKKAVEHLLGDLLLVEDYQNAARLVRLHQGVAVATLDGEVFMPGGSVSGGSQKGGPGGIELRRRTKQLEVSLEGIQGEITRLQSALSEAENLEIKTAREKDETSRKLREAEEEFRLLEVGKARVEREASRLLELLERTRSALSQSGKTFQEAVLELQQTHTLLRSMENPADELAEAESLSSLETEVLLAEERQRGFLELLGRVLKEKAALVESLGQADEEMTTRRRTVERLISDLAGLGKEYFSFWEKRKEWLSLENALAERSARDGKDLVRVVAREGRAQEASRRCLTRLGELKNEIMEAENSLAELIGEWDDKYPYPGGGTCEETDLEEVKKAMRNAEKALRGMGTVEMGVLSEESSLRERTSFLAVQSADVREGISTLQGFISDTDRQASRVFKVAMEGIDRRFDTLFQRLFGGGEAHLEIDGEAGGWDAGVEVTARPPGKRPQGLAQLSGGEQSLTAIALLFAAMEEAHVPIAVLDEADAALDEVNLRRYVDLAGEYSRDLQILAMTHRRTTMEKASVLYGITLSEPGLSQVVGVRMEDWA